MRLDGAPRGNSSYMEIKRPLEAQTCYLTPMEMPYSHQVHLGLCGVASLHPHTPLALCSLVMAQLLHLQETHRAALPPPQNRPNLPQEEGDETG